MKIKIYVSVFIVVLAVAGLVYAHCHNVDKYGNTSCEDNTQAQGQYYWDEPYNNTIEYWVNPNHGSMPSLTADVKHMAKKWSFIQFQGGTIWVKLKFRDTTTRKADNLDGVNVAGSSRLISAWCFELSLTL